MKNIGGFIGLAILCGISSYIAFLASAFSINATVIEVVLIYCFICFATSLGFLSYKKPMRAIIFAILPAPGLIAALFSWVFFVKNVWPVFEREPPEFTVACKTAGARFVSAPALPVHSIAYDWSGEHKPEIGPFLLGSNGRIEQIGSLPRRSQEFDDAIEFTESKRFNDYGEKVTGPKYIRVNSNAGTASYDKGVNVDNLTADILVYYQISPESELAKAAVRQNTVTYDLTVTDRRSNQLIATMRYVVDRKDWRLCGPLNNRVLRVDDFVAKALGFN